jgi:hypothetical protein
MEIEKAAAEIFWLARTTLLPIVRILLREERSRHGRTQQLGVTKEQHQGNILGFSYIAPPLHPLSSL